MADFHSKTPIFFFNHHINLSLARMDIMDLR